MTRGKQQSNGKLHVSIEACIRRGKSAPGGGGGGVSSVDEICIHGRYGACKLTCIVLCRGAATGLCANAALRLHTARNPDQARASLASSCLDGLNSSRCSVPKHLRHRHSWSITLKSGQS